MLSKGEESCLFPSGNQLLRNDKPPTSVLLGEIQTRYTYILIGDAFFQSDYCPIMTSI